MSTIATQETTDGTTTTDRPDSARPVHDLMIVDVAVFGDLSNDEIKPGLTALARHGNVAMVIGSYSLDLLYMCPALLTECFPGMSPVNVSLRQLIEMHEDLVDRWLNIAASNLSSRVGPNWAVIVHERDLPGVSDAGLQPQLVKSQKHRVALFLRHLASLGHYVHDFHICIISKDGTAKVLTLDEMQNRLEFTVMTAPD